MFIFLGRIRLSGYGDYHIREAVNLGQINPKNEEEVTTQTMALLFCILVMMKVENVYNFEVD